MPLSTLGQPVYAAKAELFRALGHPARIRILELLVDGEKPVSDLLAEIADRTPVTRTLVSGLTIDTTFTPAVP